MPREVGEDVVYVLPVHQARACVSLLVVVEACLGVTDFAMRNKGVRACVQLRYKDGTNTNATSLRCASYTE